MADLSFQMAGPQRLNQLGGNYINGKPIPKEVRQEIIALAYAGVRQSEISRRLRITHGCISKLLSKYRKTGSVDPGGESIGRPRVITPRIAGKIDGYRQEQPGMFSWEIRDRLLQENICSEETLPSLSSITRLIKNEMIREKKERGQMLRRANISYETSTASILNSPSNGTVFATNDKTFQSHEKSDGAMFNAESCGLGNGEYFFPLQMQKRERTKYTSRQVSELEAAFIKNQYPSSADRDQLAKEIGADKSRIQVWFSNRRSKIRKRRHSVDHTDFRSQPLHKCTCRHYSKSLVPQRLIEPGLTRIFFPLSQV